LKISVRIAVHTGECEIVDEHVRGIAVDQARQIAMLASIGEVLLSDTVKNLVVGSGLEFVERATIRLANDQFEHRVFQAIG
jgi:class 3 adenylate cyclase